MELSLTLMIRLQTFFLSMLLLSKVSYSDPHFVDVHCVDTAGSYIQQSPYQTNLNTLLLSLIYATGNSFYTFNQIGDTPSTTSYGFYYCRGDARSIDCNTCVAAAAAKVLSSCPLFKEAIIWFDECTLVYANRFVSSLEQEDPWIWRRSETILSNVDQISQVELATRLDSLILQAVYNYTSVKYFGSETSEITIGRNLQGGLNMLVQCNPGVGENECEKCLRRVVGEIPACCGWGSIWVKIFSPSCEMMYTLTTGSTKPRRRRRSSNFKLEFDYRTKLTVGISIGTSFTVTVSIFGLRKYFKQDKHGDPPTVTSNPDKVDSSSTAPPTTPGTGSIKTGTNCECHSHGEDDESPTCNFECSLDDMCWCLS